jgi:hypothetical protein
MKARAQDEGVDEEADETFYLTAITIGDGRADDDVSLMGVAIE